MADIDSIIAGAGGGTRADFANFDPVKAFFDASKERSDFDTRRALQNGVPTIPDGQPGAGQPDFPAMAKTFFQKGDVGTGVALTNLALQQSRLKYGQDTDAVINPPSNGAQPPIVGPSTSRNSVTIDPTKRADSATAPQPVQQPQQNGPQGTTLMQVLSAQGIPNDQLGAAAASVGRQLGLQDPNQPIDLQDPQVRNVLVPAVQQLKRMGIGQVVPVGQPSPSPQPVPQVAQATPQAQYAPQGMPPQSGPTDPRFVGLVPAGRTPDMQVHLLQRAIDSGLLQPEQVRSYQSAIDAIRKAAEPTPEEKSFAASQRNHKLDEYTAQQEAAKTSARGVAEADVKEQNDLIGAGRQASQRLATLNTLSNIVNSDKNLTLGFGADTALKVKMALKQMGVDVGDLSGAEAIQKLNASLASEAAKSISARPAQFEFKTFLGNNPGLSLDKQGNQRVIGIFSQLAKRDVDLGKLARQNRDNWENWDNVVENYDKKNPIRDPATGQPITTDSIVAPGPSNTSAPSSRPALVPGKTVINGHTYIGGNPNSKASWELRS